MATASINLRGVAGDLRELPRSSMIAAARAAKKIAAEEGRPPWRKRKRAIKLRAVDNIGARGDTVVCRVQGVPVGLWVMRNEGAAPHAVPRARKRKGKTKLLGLPGHPVPAPPGVVGAGRLRARGSWGRVIARAEAVVPAIFAEDVGRVVR